MQPFDYLFELVSIIIGLAIADLCLSLHRLISTPHPVRWHWHSPVTAGILVLVMLDIWWGMRLLGRLDIAWSIGTFLPMFAGLVLFFLLAAAALPDEVDPGGLDLKAHYEGRRRYFWFLFAAFVMVFALHEMLILLLLGLISDFASGAMRASNEIALAIVALVLAKVRRPLVHSLALPVLLVGLLLLNVTRPMT